MSVPRSKSALGNAVKRAKADGQDPALDPRVTSARRELAEAKIRAYILASVAEAPPLSDEQRSRLAALLSQGVTQLSSPQVRPSDSGPGAA